MNITVKDIPTDLHRRLKAQAQAHKRSLNMEIIATLEAATMSTPVDVESLLVEFDSVRKRFKGPTFTSAELRAMKTEGRR